MGALLREHPWHQTPLGSPQAWPRSLLTLVTTMLDCQLPMYVAWGPQLLQFYNDAYRPILGAKHPALGRPAPEVWHEIWPKVGPMWQEVLDGRPIGFQDFRLTIERFGYPEDCYFNFSYSPVRDDEHRIAGVLVTFAETTRQVASERRLRFLDDLGQATRAIERPEDVMRVAARMLGQHLGANRCAYANVLEDQDTFDLIGDYNDGVPSIVGRYRFTDFGQAVHELMLRNEAYVNHDVELDPRTAGTDLGSYRLTRIASVICVPLHKQGAFVGGMAVHQARPRRWSAEEVDLVRTVVDRCWESLERIRSHAAIANANRRLELAFEAGGLGDWSWDATTDKVSLSERAADLFDVPRGEQVTWARMLQLLHPDDREPAREAVERALRERSAYSNEYRLLLDNEQCRWLHAQGSGVYAADGAALGMVGVVQDVTARREEQDRAATEARVLEVLNRTGAALAGELGLDALLQRVTDAATEGTGAQFGAFFYNGTDGQGEALLLYTLSGAPREAFAGLGHPRPTALFGPTFRGEPPIRIDDVTADHRFGQWEPHRGMPPGHLPVRSYLAVPVISRQGEVIGGLFFGHGKPGVFSARSERLAVGIAGQAAIAVDNARLYAQAQQAAEDRRALLESERAARSEAERASTLKDEFLATLSHELRTPLSSILGWVHILRTKLKLSAPDLLQGIDVIERSTRVQVQLIEDLLDMSRITSGKLRLELQPVAPVTFVRAALDMIRPAADNAGITLVEALEPAGTVMADASRLQQVIWNLLANAIKFTPRGGEVRVALRLAGPTVQISVQDTGVGIPPDFLPHIFERFRQADGSITRRFGGLGLGLSIVKHLVELHGGRIRAASDGPGRGSRFDLELPVAPAKGEALILRAAPAGDAAQPELRGARILVVDDEADARNLLRRLLEDCGAQVQVAADARTAITMCQDLLPDLVVSDIGMPGMDGYQLLRGLRRLPREHGGETPAIALTAFARSEDRTRALDAGFAAHVTKPMEPAAVLATIAEVLGAGKSPPA
ncbi:MAG TPA: ATP-binding protein [Ramlibacter sp.]|nr:ATP-binding protein [Ramlibacter sp.]